MAFSPKIAPPERFSEESRLEESKAVVMPRHCCIGACRTDHEDIEMRYMMIIHHDDEAMAKAPQRELWAEYAAFGEALNKAGEGFSGGLRLTPSKEGTVVRTRDGKTDVLDGPYADTREQLAGYFFIDVPTLEEAVAWANRCPGSRFGAVEIRPIFGYGGS
jgi:hypothetical protein